MIKWAHSQKQLAKAFGVSAVAVHKWVKHPEWPFGNSGPWNVPKVKIWRAAYLDQQHEPVSRPAETPKEVGIGPFERAASVMQLERIRTAQLKRELIEHELAQLNHEYVKIEDVHAQIAAVTQELQASLLNLPKSLIPVVYNLSPEEQVSAWEAEIVRILTDFATKAKDGNA